MCFVMLRLATHCFVRLSFLAFFLIDVFHFFVLKQKSGAKKFKANPNRSARFEGPRTAAPNCYPHQSSKYNY
jgi:hypothetical protein